MKWYNPQMAPFEIYGFPFYEIDGLFRRMPLNPPAPLSEAVYDLANETAGGQIRFHGKFKTLKVQVSLASKPLFFHTTKAPHLPLITKCAFDLYASKDGKEYEYMTTSTSFDYQDLYYESTYINTEDAVEVDALLFFPLYGAVDRILIGFDDEAEISAPRMHFCDDKKIVIYGCSVEQGGCASRPGTVPSNLLSRWMNREVYNLGFNSSAKAEPEVAETISLIDDVAALVVSVEGNCPTVQWLDEKLRAFIQIYRKKHPETPIVIMPYRQSAIDRLVSERFAFGSAMLEAQEKIVADCNQAGDQNVYLLHKDAEDERDFQGHNIWFEGFCDGLHKNDLGYLSTTKSLYTFLTKKISI